MAAAAALELRFAWRIRAAFLEKGLVMNAFQQIKGTNYSARHIGRRVSLLLPVVLDNKGFRYFASDRAMAMAAFYVQKLCY